MTRQKPDITSPLLSFLAPHVNIPR